MAFSWWCWRSLGFAAADGSGFETVDDLHSSLDDSSWKRLEIFFVRKIIYDSKNPNCAYVVAHKGFYKVTISRYVYASRS